MDSSISHFEPVRPVRAATLLLTAGLTWAACIFYTLRLNPEVTHYVDGARIKTAWSQQLTAKYGSKTVVFGGSSCEFSINGVQLLSEHGLPVVNFGGHAGMGPAVIAEAALKQLKRGDTLIVALEPTLLTGTFEQTSLGIQFCVASNHLEWVRRPALGQASTNWAEILAALRPGGYHTFTILAKLLRRQPLYRYQTHDYNVSGWAQTPVRLPITGPDWHNGILTTEGRLILTNLRRWCDANGVRIAYSLPWCYTPQEHVAKYRQQNRLLLSEIGTLMPILVDPRLGADTDRDHFADTVYHLNEVGSKLRCSELAHQIKAW